MSSFFSKIKKGIQNPKAAFQYISGGRWREKNYRWGDALGKVRRKEYRTYDDYLAHQKSKLEKIKSRWLPEQDRAYREALSQRLAEDKISSTGKNVLCLGARTGAEVKTFLEFGSFAVGIDLNPGVENKYVIMGDFHHLQFPDSVVDIIYTNSLDHAFDLKGVVAEIKRVLKTDGLLILEIMKGVKEGVTPRYYESLSWDTAEEVLSFFLNAGFSVLRRSDFTYPWDGIHVVLKTTP